MNNEALKTDLFILLPIKNMVNKAYLYVTLPIFSVKNGTALAQATRHLHPEVEKRILVPTSIAMMVCYSDPKQ